MISIEGGCTLHDPFLNLLALLHPPFTFLYRAQDYNDGSAVFPYATECTLSDTCDSDALVDEMEYPDMAEGVSLDLTDANASDAVGLVSG